MKKNVTYTIACPYQRLKKADFQDIIEHSDITGKFHFDIKNGYINCWLVEYYGKSYEISETVRYYEK